MAQIRIVPREGALVIWIVCSWLHPLPGPCLQTPRYSLPCLCRVAWWELKCVFPLYWLELVVERTIAVLKQAYVDVLHFIFLKEDDMFMSLVFTQCPLPPRKGRRWNTLRCSVCCSWFFSPHPPLFADLCKPSVFYLPASIPRLPPRGSAAAGTVSFFLYSVSSSSSILITKLSKIPSFT